MAGTAATAWDMAGTAATAWDMAYGGYGLGYGGTAATAWDTAAMAVTAAMVATAIRTMAVTDGLRLPYWQLWAGYSYPYMNTVYSVRPRASVIRRPMSLRLRARSTGWPAQGRYLGIDEEPVVDAGGRKGMKVANVYPGTPAEKPDSSPAT